MKNAGQDFGISRSDIALEILDLVEDNFYKSMPAEKAPGLFQDVYIKIQINEFAVIISFKKK